MERENDEHINLLHGKVRARIACTNAMLRRAPSGEAACVLPQHGAPPHGNIQVSALKEMTIQIGNHVKEDINMLDGMGSDFDRTGGLLRGTMSRLDALVQTKDGRHMIYLALFVIGVFIVLYVFSRR
mmetsp:Transcript_14458/g.37438  ORF Transcript_14458/g.37438 Transcript_14458/m.37438 type:complete len:127 (+) Transcript_14458:300-680(+)